MNRQLQRISSVPRVSGEDTKLAGVLGTVQVVSNITYACELAAKSRARMRYVAILGILFKASAAGERREKINAYV